MKLGTRARTVLLYLVWHTFVQPLGRVRRASKGILHKEFVLTCLYEKHQYNLSTSSQTMAILSKTILVCNIPTNTPLCLTKPEVCIVSRVNQDRTKIWLHLNNGYVLQRCYYSQILLPELNKTFLILQHVL